MEQDKENQLNLPKLSIPQDIKVFQGNYYTLDGEQTPNPDGTTEFKTCKALYYKSKKPIPGR
ncbi:hypothetical protein SPOG_03089 [Schizosaccharomyces cryophilus OY26]|uniref:Uncharacterized protein n=1 Tax=Schizosaccharomyces cryophilus (strain OY26 / ATCC MYA-4695 / CBS 11777 / NBRC 106824 / NRRL Y48691) TaxID=653667 RepID=S9W160_SCHCR|nr:uncharacterized protein SPOG_03089 [Schizosaccharomyces cryophilus OY26]EPY53678.1 hypothetical protein SPOG_03089 [Schizosaccharomyces cryophilus OY26]